MSLDGELRRPKLPLVLGHEIVGTIVEKGSRGRPVCDRRPGRRALARLDLRGLRILPRRSREFVRPRPLHRLPDRWRLCRADRRRPALLLCDRCALRRCRGGAAAVRRADRLPHACAWPAMAGWSAFTGLAPPPTSSPRSSAIRADDCSRLPGRATRGAGISPAGSAPNGPAISTMLPPEPLDAALIFAPVGALVPAALAATKKGRHRRLRRHSYERHPVLSLSLVVGGAGAALGRQSDASGRRGISGIGAAGRGRGPRRSPTRWPGPTRHSTTCAMAGCMAPPCWFLDRPAGPTSEELAYDRFLRVLRQPAARRYRSAPSIAIDGNRRNNRNTSGHRRGRAGKLRSDAAVLHRSTHGGAGLQIHGRARLDRQATVSS